MNSQDGERLAPQRAPVADRRLSSKPPTTAGHDTREGLKRPLQARGSPDCPCLLNCTTLGTALVGGQYPSGPRCQEGHRWFSK